MRIGIVILNYCDSDTTLKMLNQIKDYNVLDLIVVVDNDSKDDSYEKLKKEENEKIKVIKTDRNSGYASGNDYGLRYLSDKNIDYVIISNPDVIVEESVIVELKKDLESENISLIAPTIKENGSISRGWKLPGFKEDLISNITYFHKYSKKMLSYKDNYYDKKIVSVEAVHGCFFMIKYNKFKDIDFFDENTFLYYEENILGKKLKDKGEITGVDTNLEVIHDLSVSVDKSLNSLKKYKILKASQFYYEKNYNKLNILGLGLLKFFYYISYGISYLYLLIGGHKK